MFELNATVTAAAAVNGADSAFDWRDSCLAGCCLR